MFGMHELIPQMLHLGAEAAIEDLDGNLPIHYAIDFNQS